MTGSMEPVGERRRRAVIGWTVGILLVLVAAVAAFLLINRDTGPVTVAVPSGLLTQTQAVAEARMDEALEHAVRERLLGRRGTAYVAGLQSAGVDATLKHFLGYSASRAGRNHAPVHAGPREVREHAVQRRVATLACGLACGHRATLPHRARLAGDAAPLDHGQIPRTRLVRHPEGAKT